LPVSKIPADSGFAVGGRRETCVVQSPLVTAIGQDGQAHGPSFVHWMIQVAHLLDRNKAR